MVTQNGQSRETGNAGHKRQRNKPKEKKTQHNVVGHHYLQANTNNVNKTTGGRNEPYIVCMRNSQHETQNVKTNNRRTHKNKKISNTDLNDR